MIGFNFERTMPKVENPLKEMNSPKEGMHEMEDLDYPIAKCVIVREKTGKFFDNPTIKGVKSWLILLM